MQPHPSLRWYQSWIQKVETSCKGYLSATLAFACPRTKLWLTRTSTISIPQFVIYELSIKFCKFSWVYLTNFRVHFYFSCTVYAVCTLEFVEWVFLIVLQVILMCSSTEKIVTPLHRLEIITWICKLQFAYIRVAALPASRISLLQKAVFVLQPTVLSRYLLETSVN